MCMRIIIHAQFSLLKINSSSTVVHFFFTCILFLNTLDEISVGASGSEPATSKANSHSIP